MPFNFLTNKISSPEKITDYIFTRVPVEMNYLNFYLLIMFTLFMSFTTLIVPTGRYFVSLGSSEILVFTF